MISSPSSLVLRSRSADSMTKRLSLIDDLFKPADGHWPFSQARIRPFGLLAVKTLPPAIFLDHHVWDFVDALVGRKAFLALQVLAAAADRVRFLAFARIDHLVIFKPAEGTLHMALGLALEYQ